MEDLYKVLLGAQESEARGMADRLEKYIRGWMAGIFFDLQSNIDLNNNMTVFFNKKNLEENVKVCGILYNSLTMSDNDKKES